MITRGSEWNKWNLHLHSKYSKESRTKMEIKDIFECAVNSNIKMIAITDHSNFDGLDETWNVYENESCSKGKYKDIIHFLPGIELKTDKGKKGVHIISIFPDKVNIKGVFIKSTKKVLYDNFCSQIGLTESVIESNGNGDYSRGLLATPVKLEDAVNLTHQLGGIVIVHGGDKHGSIEEEMKHCKSANPTPEELYEYLDITKSDIISNKIDVIEIPNFNRREAKNAEFYMKNFCKPCMIASDSHEKCDYDTISEMCTWVKADCTFEGLRQALIDFENRICLKDMPEQLERIKKNPTKYIDEINIDWVSDYSGEKGIWFKAIRLPLNPGLVSIIGNKGNGKSALAEVIAWISDSKNYEKFAFLNEKKFLKSKLANNFVGKLKWKDEEDVIIRNLGDPPNITNVERVQCIPQQYFEDLCTDTELQKFACEINGVIFSRLSNEEKEGERSLEDLIERHSKVAETNISYLASDLNSINKQIIDIEKKLLPEYKDTQCAMLKDAKKQLDAHIKVCPKEVKKPELSQEIQNKYDEIIIEAENLKSKIEDIENQIFELSVNSSKLNLIIETIGEFENRILIEKDKIRQQIEEYNLNIDEIINIKIDKKSIQQKKNEIDTNLTKLRQKINDKENGLKKQLNDKENIKKTILSEENRNIIAYDKYLKDYQEWLKIKGEKESIVSKIESEILYLNDEINNDLLPLFDNRKKISSNICKEKKKIINIYDRFKVPIDNFIQENADLLNDYSINIRSGLIIDKSFTQDLFDYINKQKKNAFRDDNYQLYKSIEELNNIDSIDDFEEIPNLILDYIKKHSMNVGAQIKDNKLLDFYNYLYGMKYVINKYELISENKTLDKLSPGERGALLLIFYLLLDMRDIPLIIDQPEDNLDNQSVTKVLVPFIQAAKKRRQIILVTHNPNLAVVADSDQIVHVKIDKQNNQTVEIEASGIENQKINECIVTILEGTMNSFRKRDVKYLKNNNI